MAKKNLEIFGELCGQQNFTNVRIVTTDWTRATTPDSLLDEMDFGHFNFVVYNSDHRIDGGELDDKFEYDPTEPSLILPFIKNQAHGIPIDHLPQYAA